MSRYIPASAVKRETDAQIMRRARGLKTGEYVKYPDAEKGPFVIKVSKIKRLEKSEEGLKTLEEIKKVAEAHFAETSNVPRATEASSETAT